MRQLHSEQRHIILVQTSITQKKVFDDDEGPGRQIISLSLYYAIRRITNFPSLSSDYFLHYIRLKYLLLHSFAFPNHHTTLYCPNRIPRKFFFASAQLFKKIFSSFENLQPPETLTDVRAIFGLVENIAYTFHCSSIMAPFRELLKPGNAEQGKITWTKELDAAFIAAKQAMAEAMNEGVKIFDPKLPTSIEPDWSKNGIGQILKQKHCACTNVHPDCCKTGWKAVAYASRFCHPAEKNYSPIEGEALSAAVGFHKFRYFVLGCENLFLVVETC